MKQAAGFADGVTEQRQLSFVSPWPSSLNGTDGTNGARPGTPSHCWHSASVSEPRGRSTTTKQFGNPFGPTGSAMGKQAKEMVVGP
jgi:hypothetical protein